MAQGAGAPIDYVAVSYLAVTASLIGGKRKVKPYAEADWTEPCIVWVGNVGDPSSGKSPGLDRTTSVLREIERDYAEQHKETLNSWRGDVERAKVEFSAYQARVKDASKDSLSTPPLPTDAVEPALPQRRRLLVQDSTPRRCGDPER